VEVTLSLVFELNHHYDCLEKRTDKEEDIIQIQEQYVLGEVLEL